MGRFRKIFYRNGATVTIEDDVVTDVQGEIPGSPDQATYYMPDASEFVTFDDTLLGGRAAVREYEKRTGTRQCGHLMSMDDRRKMMNAHFGRNPDGSCVVPKEHHHVSWVDPD